LALACLWTSNHKDLDGNRAQEPLLSTTIITTDAGADTRSVHDRMPVVLQDETAVARWLSSQAHWQSIKDLVGPAGAGTLQPTRVSSKANSVRNQGPELIAPELYTPDLF
jgi:putative SOS response-associated peptidase YedK